jgi:hypothetical protein
MLPTAAESLLTNSPPVPAEIHNTAIIRAGIYLNVGTIQY